MKKELLAILTQQEDIRWNATEGREGVGIEQNIARQQKHQ